MNVELIKSTADLRRVQQQMRRRFVKLKVDDSAVSVTKCGSLFRARLEGHPDSVFGPSPGLAKQQLSKLLTMGDAVIPKASDVELDKTERVAERAAKRAAKNSIKFNPKGR